MWTNWVPALIRATAAINAGSFQARSRQRSNRGDDLRYDLTITFEEAFTGVEKQIEVPRLVTCEHCTGTGSEPGTGVETCPTCRGSGQIRRSAQSFLGSVVTLIRP